MKSFYWVFLAFLAVHLVNSAPIQSENKNDNKTAEITKKDDTDKVKENVDKVKDVAEPVKEKIVNEVKSEPKPSSDLKLANSQTTKADDVPTGDKNYVSTTAKMSTKVESKDTTLERAKSVKVDETTKKDATVKDKAAKAAGDGKVTKKAAKKVKGEEEQKDLPNHEEEVEYKQPHDKYDDIPDHVFVNREHGSSFFNYLVILVVLGAIGYVYRKKIFTMIAGSRRSTRRNVRYRKLSTGETDSTFD
ncbi:unnamed protein product [Bursaphelenchus okinawaensis]|uniref:Trans-golgi network protein 2 n=1 Tax=Bursaphelenchus okinawaensis TaxID=465554 RepID=A0A811L0E5_9BILA|nr:unnamed protein product [Bursaphelenchus okinawaensis]CAG9115414.1 unnamed protein product [Bursaphelenchus okinawaensis]